MGRILTIFMGIITIGLGVGVFLKPKWYSQSYELIMDLTKVKGPFSFFAILVGILLIVNELKKK